MSRGSKKAQSKDQAYSFGVADERDRQRESEGVVVQAARAVVAEWLRWMRELPDDFQIDGPVMVAIHKLSTLIPKEDND